ncbi:acylpyruvase FAHD1, mitochondrial-like isoform X2 [Bacillus rossius redtenbacheri]|uniref:acylpyruvase FAHD1, mitochondrial-like isoform X2 n=1 Tax=Bacillus rossius redtenbacheri TaxID=93214 RepID=UPI002FDD31E7
MIPNPFLVMPLSDFVKAGRKIVGAGLNYFALLAEKNLPKPSQPVLFLKPTSSYITEGQDIKIPPGFLIKEEVELGVIIGTKCRNVSPDSAMSYVGGYCLALDMTEVNLMMCGGLPRSQDEAKRKGLPWTFAKGFDTACPVSRLLSPEELGDPHDVRIWSRVNGRPVQDASTSDLVFRVPELLAAITSVQSRCVVKGEFICECYCRTLSEFCKWALTDTIHLRLGCLHFV